MIHQSTIELLKEMRFSGMAAELEKQLNSAEAYREMPFEDRLAMLVDAEWNRRQSNKYLRCIHGARFAIHDATVEGIEAGTEWPEYIAEHLIISYLILACSAAGSFSESEMSRLTPRHGAASIATFLMKRKR